LLPKLAPQPWNQLAETLDGAAAADPRVDCIAVGADALVARLKVKAVVEIKGRAILVELRPHPGAIGKDEIHLLWTGQQGALDLACRYAFRALFLNPFNIRKNRMGLDRDTDDHFVFDYKPGDGLADSARLRGKHAEQ